MAVLTLILERHERRFGQIDHRDFPNIDGMDWYAIYIDDGPASKPCWRWGGFGWEPCF